MANTDKDILITPNDGQVSNPVMKFSGANNTPIYLKVADNGTVSFESESAAQLLSIALSGTVFSVKDSSGNSVISTADTGLIDLASSSGNVVIGGIAPISSSALSVLSRTASMPTLILRGATSQTADLQRWTNASNEILAKVNKDGKATFAGAIFTDNISGTNLSLSGDFYVGGTTTFVDTTSVALSDNLIYLNEAISYEITNAVGNGTTITYTTSIDHAVTTSMYVRISGVDPSGYNTSEYVSVNSVTNNSITIDGSFSGTYISGGILKAKASLNPDIGLVGAYNDGSYAHLGIVRDASDNNTWKFFHGLVSEPTGSTIDFSSATLSPIRASSITVDSATIGNVSNTEIQYLEGVTSAIQTQINDKVTNATTTAGDMLYASSTGIPGTIARLGVGTNGQVLSVSSGLPTWITPLSIPSVSGNAGLYLYTDGSTVSWNGISAGVAQPTPPANPTDGSMWLDTDGALTGIGAYYPPTIGSTLIPSNATVTTIAGLTLTSPTINGGTISSASISDGTISLPALTLSTTTSTAEGRIAWDATNNKIIVGDGSTTTEFVSSTIIINSQGAGYTLALLDKDQMVEMSGGGTLTIPLDSTINFPIGSQIIVLQTGTTQVIFAGASGVTVNATPGLKLRAQWSSATLIKRAANNWVVIGDLIA